MLTQIRSGVVKEVAKDIGSIDRERNQLRQEAEQFYAAAKVKAEVGEVSEAGFLILKGLDCERRARAKGPQVLGLIRKRD